MTAFPSDSGDLPAVLNAFVCCCCAALPRGLHSDEEDSKGKPKRKERTQRQEQKK